MPRPNAPWFREAKNTWHVTTGGRKVSLGVKGRQNRKEAMLAFAALLVVGDWASTGSRVHVGTVEGPASSPTVAALVESFRADAATRLEPSTFRWYREDLSQLRKAFGTARGQGPR